MSGDRSVIEVTGPSPYPVVVGRDVLAEVPTMLPDATRAAVVHTPPLAGYAQQVADRLQAAGITPTLLPVPDAEAGKTVQVAAGCWDALGAAGFTRNDAVVGVGEEPPPTWPGSWPRPGYAGCAGWRCRPACWAWWMRRSVARPG